MRFESDGHVQGEDSDHDDGGPAWDPETQPPDIREDEVIAIAVANSELDQLAMLDGLTIQLVESLLAQGRPTTPLATPTRTHMCRLLILRRPGIRSHLHHSLLLLIIGVNEVNEYRRSWRCACLAATRVTRRCHWPALS
jgi:hypothetical protein